MSGMLQHGSNTLIQLSALPLQGTVAGFNASTTLSIASPLIKAGDVPLLAFAQFPEGLGIGVFLQEWYCDDGFLRLTYRGTGEGGFEMNQLVSVALLRSPGFVRGPQPIPTMGVPMRFDDTANNGAPGPRYPLWIATATNTAQVTVNAGESVAFNCPMWALGAPVSQTQTLPCQFQGPASMPDGLAITAWHVFAQAGGPGSFLRLGVINRTGAPIVIPIGGIGEARVLVAGSQAYAPNTRSFAMGGRIPGPVQRHHIRGATYPAANQDVQALPAVTCPVTASAPDGQRIGDAQAPAGARIWASAPRGTTGTGIGWTRLNQHGASGNCTHRTSVTAATTVNANTLTQDMQHVDFIV